MSLAVLQMVSQEAVPANLLAARRLLERAAESGARLAVLPENFAAMGRRDLAGLARAEAAGEGPLLPWLRQAARDLGLWIVAGTLPLPPDEQPLGRPHATSLLIDEHGERVARYDKLHLFDVEVADSRGRYRESEDYLHGARVVVADTPVGRLGLSVCYDLRFPELYLALRAAGAELISVPAAFTAVTGAAHWQVLLRARAIETQCYLLAANQGGQHPGGRETFGHSAIVDAWGRVLAEQPLGEAVLLAARDPAAQQAIRQNMPLASQRRFSPPGAPLPVDQENP
ncbi:carbon-nitrogen hydrolase family protein [Pseudomonas sp. N040]|uniref:carbon-nitrogen hydrolase family protein n=1 Tax=Pseudomonas sp. N040 TaxID=2785325 RepID=UPI0018A2B3E5|nr:carbon-nitrogen hydrolase family protein [Pseudomonas sp. N040]MBF7730295.1 carbon-nitrogen hydrolase family protein [Pseudomonas sp. N040]MBW7013937.1 carbon-nitrogen hydrolase family protein [Pseudomonas sp. N040]